MADNIGVSPGSFGGNPRGIHIGEPQQLQEKLQLLREDSSACLHVIADFDKTLTKAHVAGKKIISTYSLLRDGGYLTPDYPKRAYAAFDKYHPYEIDSSLSLREKSAMMAEWWKVHWEMMVECGMNKEVLNDLILKEKLQLRDGAEDFFHMLSSSKIPFLIFSSGMGDVITEFLKKKKLLTPNVHIIANFFEFNTHGKAVSYRKPLIHVFNKNEVEIKAYPYHQEIERRKNVILLGDSLGDLGMTEGIEHKIVLKVGFLNDNNNDNNNNYGGNDSGNNHQEKLNDYANAFDVVILDDGPMDYINRILIRIFDI